MTQYPKRLIEVDLPIRRISAHARREKSIRHGHISTLHIWWARRPLASCRAVVCAALWPDPADPHCPDSFREDARAHMEVWARRHLKLLSPDSYSRFKTVQKHPETLADPVQLREALLDFIADFSNWNNAKKPAYLETTSALTASAHRALGGDTGTRPLVVDPFAGGGAIPLEALRVGADAFASDLNPVAVLLNKVVLEYIPRYGKQLSEELWRWGKWIANKAAEELSSVYPEDPDGSTPIAFLWARVIRCEGPGCGIELPLVRSTQITQKEPRTNMRVVAVSDGVEITLHAGKELHSTATVHGGKATCPRCGFTTSERRVKAQTSEVHGGADSARLLAVLVERGGKRRFRAPTELDIGAAELARRLLNKAAEANPNAIPAEAINPLRPYKNTVGVSIVPKLGITRFIDLYTSRQALSLLTFQRLIREAAVQLRSGDTALSEAVQTVLCLALDRLVMQNTSLSRWDTTRSSIQGLFSKQALQVVWDFAESNPISKGMATWDGALTWVGKVIDENRVITHTGVAELSAAEQIPIPDESIDFVFTDPPYFAAIVYADLSDVFYVWLRRALADVHPSLFRAELVERSQELVVTNSATGASGETKDERFFSAAMTRALAHAKRATKPSGLGCIVFADSSTTSWEAMLQAVIQGGWMVTASWPIDTEMQNRTRAQASASLQSSVFMVVRPRSEADAPVGDWADVLEELPRRIHAWMPRLAKEGIVGADAIFACLGPALEIFSRYARVDKANGDEVPLKEFLEFVWAAVAKEALAMVFSGADVSGFEEDARLTAMWFWTLSASPDSFGSTSELSADEGEDEGDEEVSQPASRGGSKGFSLEYDAVRKIAQGLGVHLGVLGHLVQVKGDRARLLPVVERAGYLFGTTQPAATASRRRGSQLAFGDSLAAAGEEVGIWEPPAATPVGNTVLDRIHQAMLLFSSGRSEAIRRFLVDDGVGRDERFWRLAQALSALYPVGTDEKRWIDGLLARKKGLGF